MIHMITYDLHQAGRNYPQVHELLTKNKAIHPMGSVWLVDTVLTVATWRDMLKEATDDNDEIFVTRLASKSWASYKLDKDAVTWLKSPERSW